MSGDDWTRIEALLEEGDLDSLLAVLRQEPELARLVGPSGESTVMAALYRRRRDLADALAGAKENVDLFELVGMGLVPGVEALIEMAGRPQETVNLVSPDGFTVLQLACYLAQPAVARLVLRHGADAEAMATNGSGLRAIHASVAGGSLECLECVLAAGVDVDAPQNGGYTALQSAAHRAHVAMVEALLRAGADPERVADDGRSARDHAAEHPELLNLL